MRRLYRFLRYEAIASFSSSPPIRIELFAAIVKRLITAIDLGLESILSGFGLLRDGTLNNAAVILFGGAQHLQSLYPQMSIQLARFRGKDRLADFTDNRRYWGNAFYLLRQAEQFLLDRSGHFTVWSISVVQGGGNLTCGQEPIRFQTRPRG